MTVHYVNGPSALHRRLGCPGSAAMEANCPDSDSVDSRRGTAGHDLAAQCLLDPTMHPAAAIGRAMSNGVAIDAGLAGDVNTYVQYCRALPTVFAIVETGVSPGWAKGDGTLDFGALLTTGEAIIVDAKFGWQPVAAENNPQLMAYMIGFLRVLSAEGHAPTSFKGVIVQPALGVIDEWRIPYERLVAFYTEANDGVALCASALAQAPEGEEYESDAFRKWSAEWLRPSPKACEWCRAKAVCPPAARFVQDKVGMLFPDMTKAVAASAPALTGDHEAALGAKLDAIGYIESWVKAVEAEGMRRALAGMPPVGAAGPYKVTRGRAGNRAWKDTDGVRKLLKGMRLKDDQINKTELISPTAAEDLLKAENPKLFERRWKKLEENINRSEGGLHLAPADDKRPAVLLTAPDAAFPDVSAPTPTAEPMMAPLLLW